MYRLFAYLNSIPTAPEVQALKQYPYHISVSKESPLQKIKRQNNLNWTYMDTSERGNKSSTSL